MAAPTAEAFLGLRVPGRHAERSGHLAGHLLHHELGDLLLLLHVLGEAVGGIELAQLGVGHIELALLGTGTVAGGAGQLSELLAVELLEERRHLGHHHGLHQLDLLLVGHVLPRGLGSLLGLVLFRLGFLGLGSLGLGGLDRGRATGVRRGRRPATGCRQSDRAHRCQDQASVNPTHVLPPARLVPDARDCCKRIREPPDGRAGRQDGWRSQLCRREAASEARYSAATREVAKGSGATLERAANTL